MIPAFFPSPLLKSTKMIDVLRDLNLTTNLKLCLDAGDSQSYDGSSQTWTDLSGGGYNFYRGTTSGAEGSDPTFNGSAGHQSKNEYFSFDGGDWFTLNQSNPSWVSAIHKNNAVFTIIEWIYANNIDSPTKPYGSMGTASASASGFYFGNTATGTGLDIELNVQNTTSTALLTKSAIQATNNAWNMLGISMTESTGALTFVINGSFDAQTSKTYSSPGTDAGLTMRLNNDPSADAAETSGNRSAIVAILDIALTQAQMTSIFTATRGRFGV